MQRDRFGKHPHGSLAGIVGSEIKTADHPGDRGQIDDGARAEFFHDPHSVFAAEEGSIEIDGMHFSPVLKGDLLHIRNQHHPCGIDEDVQTVKPFHGFIQNRDPFFFFGDVKFQEGRIGIYFLWLLTNFLKVDVSHHHPGAFLSKPDGRLETDT